MNVPSIILPGTEIKVEVEASEDATNWEIVLIGAGTTKTISPTTTYSTESEIWELVFTGPQAMGLYDLDVSATIDSTPTGHTELRSIKVVSEYKDEYKFVILGDPQFHRDGSAGYDYRNEKTGLGNFTDLLQELNIINPEFILIMGDLTEWTDEVALLKYQEWMKLYLDRVPFVSIMGNHGDWEATATTPTAWEWGSGKGVWTEIIGPTHGTFWYGDHAFILGDSSSRNYDSLPEEMDYLQEAMKAVKSTAGMKALLLHHPLTNYGDDAEMIQGDTERGQILTWLTQNSFEAHLHGHFHLDKYDEINGIHHIGTTEAVGDRPGYRIVTVKNDNFEKFSYGPPDATTYSASSWPINHLNVSYSGLNDGTETTASATVNNGLNHSLTDAHVRFKLDPTNEYAADGGVVTNSYIENGVRIVDVDLNVSAKSSHTVSLEIHIPTTTTNDTSSTTTTDGGTPTPGFLISFLFPAIIALVVYRKRK
jgi:hypothetical protein